MRFAKMNGLGNDFVIIDAITQNIYLTTKNIKYLSNRYYGIGFDQLLIVEPPYDPAIDFHCRIYNADGTEVNQCGNGIRCFAQFVYLKKLTNKRNIHISTRTHHIVLSIMDDNHISVNMGPPIFDPKLVPFYASQYQKTYILFLPTQTILCGIVSMGNPHCVILVENIETVQVNLLGSTLKNHHCFPEQVNVSFMQIIDRNKIRLRVYERGVGETQACGTAACAAVAIGIQQKLLCETVNVVLPGGTLSINWTGIGNPLYMTGSTSYVYDGYIDV
ncbi:diaminopimelate epimerase [Blochmannia endosymbiont of Camponotus sp.]|uniref:diaminopimelate epimerase n=1 Tax=Blochmannia endosymbiont of Camponotus sp. TaxID=700220 RepID=UPI002025706C|nr:diaminopimelate epimerase [Blochmannia endosymbiont of Camponotus sp.]URJ31267.1 diaminopimelate epimerase [Blochmannia endosymbiont of Camponotus sp.]